MDRDSAQVSFTAEIPLPNQGFSARFLAVFCIVAIKDAPGNTELIYFKNGQYYEEAVEAPGFDPVKLAIQSRFEPKTAEYVTARVRSDIAAVLNNLDQQLKRRAPMLIQGRRRKSLNIPASESLSQPAPKSRGPDTEAPLKPQK